jgi:hypothetical protein
MRTQSPDTHPAAEAVQIALLRGASISRRLSLACSLSQTSIQLARRAIRRAHPEMGEEELKLAFIAVHYGEALAERLRAELARRA